MSIAVEGDVDEAVMTKLVASVGGEVVRVHGKKGKAALHTHVEGYVNAARHSPWAILVDLDHGHECAPKLVNAWLPSPERPPCFHVAVRAVESWLLADADRFAAHFSVDARRVPSRPDEFEDPKAAVVALANASTSADIRREVPPRAGSGRKVGPGYVARMIAFASGQQGWRPRSAAKRSPSLARCLDRIQELVES